MTENVKQGFRKKLNINKFIKIKEIIEYLES